MKVSDRHPEDSGCIQYSADPPDLSGTFPIVAGKIPLMPSDSSSERS